jgi:hypothetical protein
MKDLIFPIVSILVVLVVAIFLSSRFKLSNRYERKPEKLTSWNRQDIGQDPSTEGRQ